MARGDDLFRGVRPYVRGDARRSVHWPATAHHGTLMVQASTTASSRWPSASSSHLPMPGSGRASTPRPGPSWLVEQSLMRGWLVHLVTIERATPIEPPPPLVRPRGPVPFTVPGAVADGAWPTTASTTRARPASSSPGPPTARPSLDRWTGLTRFVSPEGDRWQ